MSLKYVQANTLYLAGSGVIIGATSIVLTTFADIYGNVLSMTDFGAEGYITLEPDTTNEEAATFTGVTVNTNSTYTLTGVKSALAKSPYTETSGLVRQHSGGTKVVITDNVAFWNTFANKQNDETVTGRWGSATVPSANNDYVNKAYADGLAIAGAPNATLSVKGIVQLTTQAQTDAKTATGSTGAALVSTPDQKRSTLLSDYVADTGAADIAVITPVPAIAGYVVGQEFLVKMIATNVTTTPTLNVNILGAKTIVSPTGAALSPGDLLINRLYKFVYDGTNMQMASPNANNTAFTLKSATTLVSVSAATAPSSGQVLKATNSTTATWQTLPTTFVGTATKGTSSKNLSDATGVQNIAHGLGAVPAYFQLSGVSPVGGLAFSYGGNSISNTDGSANNIGQASVNFLLHNGTASNYQSGVVTADAINIIITWTKTGLPTGTLQLIWQAFV